MFGEPQRFEAASLGLAGEFDRVDRLVGGEDEYAEVHGATVPG